MEHDVTLHVFYRDTELEMVNTLMHSADMFEEGKELIKHEHLSASTSPGIPFEVSAEALKTAVIEKGFTIIFFAALRKEEAYIYFKKGVQSLSMEQDGVLKWGLFSDILKRLGFKVEIDARMRVINVTYNKIS